jgi:arylsulfatase A-like enzyme/lysophospholipase L1-like esterase
MFVPSRLFSGVTALALWAATMVVPAAAPSPRPNIVVILADDLGAHDLGVTGSRFHETPNLDRLAREGMRFTQAYSACTVCSPTRAALLTGKYPARLKLTDWIAGHDYPEAKLLPPVDWQKQLPLAERTLAERAKSAGLVTAHIGKWHLGGDGFAPEDQGFERNLGGYFRGQPPSYFAPYGLPKLADGPAGEYLTDREGTEAVKFIAENRDRPFFLNYWPYAVHTPLQAKAGLVEKYRRKTAPAGSSQTNATYAAMVESLDAAVGRILRALDEAGLTERTIVIFTSDNGGLVLGKEPPTSNAPLRSGKGSPYEGGLRVPLIVKWPGVTKPGSESAEPVITMDVAATVASALANAAGGAATAEPLNDGLDLAPLLRDPAALLGREYLGWHYPHYHPGGATPYSAIRAGEWKLIQYYEDGRHELFHLAADPGEQNDLAAAQPERVMELARKLSDWQGKVGAQWPMNNPAHQPKPLPQAADGSVLLHSRNAAVHGTTLRYEPMPFKNTLGWWGRAEDWADWGFTLDRAGTFEVELLQGCGNGHGGSEVNVEVGGMTLPFVVEETGHFQNFVPRRVGRVTLATGTYKLALKPQRKPGGAVMDVRQVRLVPVGGEAPAPTTRAFLAAKRVVFLGDSITYGGEWVEFVETWLRLKFPAAEVEFLNLGLPSETVSGLSEPGHAGGSFPRPGVHERLGRVLEKAKPDLIVACYGMNDGIYYPYGDGRAKAFQDGIRRLRERAAHEGIRVVHITPPVFDPLPLGGHTLPAGRDAYPQPFEGYNDVLDRYSAWLLSQRASGWEVVDAHGPMNRFLADHRRTDPKFLLAGDGVHANTQGHWLIAREVLRQLGAPDELVSADSPEALVKSHPQAGGVLKLVQQRQRTQKDAWLTYVGHIRPGMNQGKPLEEANREAAEVTAKLRALQ